MPATKIQPLKRLLDASDATVWIIDANGRLAYLSAAVESWLGIDPHSLLGRMSLAGTAISSDPLDQLAASLSAPPGLLQRGTASLQIQPILLSPSTLSTAQTFSRETRFIRVGCGEDHFVIAVAGEFDDRRKDGEILDAVALRQVLDHQRRASRSAFSAIIAGTSTLSRRLRQRLKVASAGRFDVLLVGTKGFCGHKIGAGFHQASAAGEPCVSIDGGLMDVELLEASLSPVTMRLSESKSSSATAMIRSLDRMPIEAQERLATLHLQFEGRLRLIGTCRRIQEPTSPESEGTSQDSDADDASPMALLEEETSAITSKLVDLFCAHILFVPPIAHRVEDVPVMATALVDSYHVHHERTVERINRSALDALVLYPWTQDYREFEEAIASAARTTSGSVIGKEHLPLAIRSYRPSDPAARAKTETIHLDTVVGRFEAQLIESAVESANGNRAEAARRLGISRARLLRKIDDIERKKKDGS